MDNQKTLIDLKLNDTLYHVTSEGKIIEYKVNSLSLSGTNEVVNINCEYKGSIKLTQFKNYNYPTAFYTIDYIEALNKSKEIISQIIDKNKSQIEKLQQQINDNLTKLRQL